MKDILIGAADLYTWEHVRPWVRSIKESGFTGDVYLICYRVDGTVEPNCAAYGVSTYNVGHDGYLREIVHEAKGSPTQAHNLRFYHAWELLTRMAVEGYHYNRVIMTDVRDVVFQSNPSLFLNEALKYGRKFIAPSEHIQYADEPWNKDNLIQGFGQVLWEITAHTWHAHNVGTIAGEAFFMRELFNAIYRMTEGRCYPSDQSSFNVLLHTCFREDAVYYSDWAAQLGTTNDPTKSYLWPHCTTRPLIRDDGTVVSPDGTLYPLVHQWDRVPQLKQFIADKYSNQ